MRTLFVGIDAHDYHYAPAGHSAGMVGPHFLNPRKLQQVEGRRNWKIVRQLRTCKTM